MNTYNLINNSVFGSEPRFKLGEAIIHSYEADLMKDGVVPAKEFGIIVGITYCDEDSVYPGWTYKIYTWKIIYEHNDRIEVEYCTDYSYSSIDESENIEQINVNNYSKLIKKIFKKQILKYNKYNNRGFEKNNFYDLLNSVLIKDTYYSDLINDEIN